MKLFYFIPLIFLTACSTTPKLTLRPQTPPPPATDSLRYPELVRAYHFGRYVDPNDGLVMHEQHVAYRVEENARWNLHPKQTGSDVFPSSLHDAAFAPAPVNDAILAEVNSQKIATMQIMAQARILSAALQQLEQALQDAKKNEQATANLRVVVDGLKKRLDALESAPAQPPIMPLSTTNAPADPMSP